MHNNARYDRSENVLELEVNARRTIGILRDDRIRRLFRFTEDPRYCAVIFKQQVLELTPLVYCDTFSSTKLYYPTTKMHFILCFACVAFNMKKAGVEGDGLKLGCIHCSSDSFRKHVNRKLT